AMQQAAQQQAAMQQRAPATPFGAPSSQAPFGAPSQPPSSSLPPFGAGPPMSGVPVKPQAAQGPITSLFAAFDATQLPPEMQRPAQPAPPPAQPSTSATPSGLQLDDGPKRLNLNLPPPTQAPPPAPERPRTSADLPKPSFTGKAAQPSMASSLASWATLVVG